MESNGIESFGSPLLADVQFEQDGSLKQTGKQNCKFYNKKRLSFRAVKDETGKLVMDPKTGLPKKEAFEEIVEFVRIETKGDTNIVDDVADEFKKRQFYRQYKHFREGRIPDGNPIEDFEFLQPSSIMELHMLGIHVIQQVGEMSDLECERLKDQSGYEIRDIAAQWVRINSPQGQAGKASRLEVENANLKRQLDEARSARRPGVRHEAPVQEQVADEPLQTMEVSAEDLKKPRKRIV